jgi:magnesium chelatase family protein
MLAKVLSGVNLGLSTVLSTIEVDIVSQGLPSFTIVGLADRSIEEARERVRSAIKNSNIDFPIKKITVNLAPANLPKVGPFFDLPIAVGILAGSGQLKFDTEDFVFAGELSLDGSLRPVPGILSLLLMAKKLGIKRAIIPIGNSEEAAILEGIEVFAFDNLYQIFLFLRGEEEEKNRAPLSLREILADINEDIEFDFAFIKGQEQAKRALEIAAAGGHNLIMKGPPGSGKTMLARTLPSIMPPLNYDEAIELIQIYSINGHFIKQQSLSLKRPFRSPHHTASYVGIIGGGSHVQPGEISMAHKGVLFMDELAEFPRQVLEALRQPLEDRKVTISRSKETIEFPADFTLIAAFNPCPCGFLDSKIKDCICSPGEIAKYKRKVSGPLLDRFDLQIEVPFVDVEKIMDKTSGEPSRDVKSRVIKARDIQKDRLKHNKLLTNAEMSSNLAKKFCVLTPESEELLKKAMVKMQLSGRGYNRVLKVARTIADLSLSEKIEIDHLAESLRYRF